MRLNPDCIREVLLTIEEQHQIHLTKLNKLVSRPLTMKSFVSQIPDYPAEDIVYSVIILNEAGYIDAEITTSDSTIANFHIRRLTYKGHEFLDEIRDGKIWSNVKTGVSTIGSFGLNTISEIARNLISSAITGFLTHG